MLSSQACVHSMTGLLLDTRTLPSPWPRPARLVRQLAITTTALLRACIAPLLTGVQSLQLTAPLAQAKHLLASNVRVDKQ